MKGRRGSEEEGGGVKGRRKRRKGEKREGLGRGRNCIEGYLIFQGCGAYLEFVLRQQVVCCCRPILTLYSQEW